MKKIIGLTLLALMSLNTLAFNINLVNEGQMSVDEIVNSGATVVSCETQFPKCILMPEKLGIQYEGQEFKDVEFLHFSRHSAAVNAFIQYKSKKICK